MKQSFYYSVTAMLVRKTFKLLFLQDTDPKITCVNSKNILLVRVCYKTPLKEVKDFYEYFK
jgi:hypothetical protein